MLVNAYSGFLGGDLNSIDGWVESLTGFGLSAVSNSDRNVGLESQTDFGLFSAGAKTSNTEIDGESIVVALCGDPYDLEGGDGAEAARVDVEKIAYRVKRRGPFGLSSIGGPFSVALITPQHREALVAIDRFSVENLYYIENKQGLVFGNRTQLLADHPACAQTFSAQAIYDYLYFHCLPGPDTGYAAIRRLLPGHYIHWKDGKVEIKPYWYPTYVEDNEATQKLLSDQLKSAMESAVGRQLGTPKAGCFLSGGLDSSTVTGMSAACNKSEITAFSIGFDSPDYDEMEFARAAANHFNVPIVPYYVTPADVAASLPEIVNAFDAPFGNASAVPTYYCAKLAAEAGMPVILAGDGGDELFGGNERYAKQLVFEKYSAIPAWLRASVMEPVATRAPKLLKGKVTRYIEQAAIPLPDRLMTYNLLEMVGASSFLTPEFLSSIDTKGPIRSLRSMYGMDSEVSTLNRMLQLDLRITLADSDLPKVSRMCELAGIRVAYPMLDEQVFDLAARLPSSLKIKSRELRYFFKRTFADVLPQSTLKKLKHGFGLPFGVWLETDPMLQEIVTTNLKVLEDAGILRRGFRDRFLGSEFQEHPGYYGTLLWVLTCLGLWLHQQKVSLQ